MSNETLFLLVMLGGAAAAVAAHAAGRAALYAYVVAIAIYINIAEAKVIDVLGLPITLGTALYGVSFLCSDLLTERYGRAAALKAVGLSVAATLAFQAFMQATLAAAPSASDPFYAAFAADLEGVFTLSLRITLAGLATYVVSQSLDIALYEALRRATGGRALWLRSVGSTLAAQAVDTALFVTLAFGGLIATEALVTLALTMYGFKVAVALAAAPFAYLGRAVAPAQDDLAPRA